MGQKKTSVESQRIAECSNKTVPDWLFWGPYVSERSWGTVREDYSDDGEAWNYFTHDQARSRAYRWSEDGIAGICDRYQVMCLTFAFWNGKDPILKERLFGLSGFQGNHGEDVKELYFYEDNVPSHAYMRYRYFYPVEKFPYEDLEKENIGRSKAQDEFEIIDTKEFLQHAFFEITVETVKITPFDLAFFVTVENHSMNQAEFTLLPQLTIRNTWSWYENEKHNRLDYDHELDAIVFEQPDDLKIAFVNFKYSVGKRYFYSQKKAEMIFTDNMTNKERLFNQKNESKFVKDGFHEYVINQKQSINLEKKGSKAGALIKKDLFLPKEKKTYLFRFSDQKLKEPFKDFENYKNQRMEEVKEFYQEFQNPLLNTEEKEIQKAALSSLIWSKQFYNFNIQTWLSGDLESKEPSPQRKFIRNQHWRHLVSKRVMLMPDKWEYPWFAAWDLAFQAMAYAYLDIEYAKEQLWLLLFDQFQHPNGQIPAYEWEFSELNPPVQATACWYLYELEQKIHGKKDTGFLKRCFHKMMINFVWWVNRVDSQGNNIFEGGFLGLDNITIFDRNRLSSGVGSIEQSDGTGWVGLFCLKLMRIALELSNEDQEYESLAVKFFEHFVYIASAIHQAKGREIGLWNEQDGFFYDVMRLSNGERKSINVRSLVGIIPLFAVDFITQEELDRHPVFKTSFNWFLEYRKDLTQDCLTHVSLPSKKGHVIALMNLDQAKRVMAKTFDENEFMSDFGLRSLSKYHEKNPFVYEEMQVKYESGESEHFMKGGNSNWRGPVWMPMNFMLIETMKAYDAIFGNHFLIPIPEKMPITFKQALQMVEKRIISLFEKKENGRPIFYGHPLFDKKGLLKDKILFFEHFDAETGRGIGASHQTGWTALIANILQDRSN
jgi:hypothetical protein